MACAFWAWINPAADRPADRDARCATGSAPLAERGRAGQLAGRASDGERPQVHRPLRVGAGQSVTGRFLSAGPVLEVGDPTQMGGYAYAADNPATLSDPSGGSPIAVPGPTSADPAATPQPPPTTTTSSRQPASQGSVTDFIGGVVNAAYRAEKAVEKWPPYPS